MILTYEGYTLQLHSNNTFICSHSGSDALFQFAGMNMDIEKTVCTNNNRRRTFSPVEEDELSVCMCAFRTTDPASLLVKNMYQHDTRFIFVVHGPWEYSNPQTRIISMRYVFYLVFRRISNANSAFYHMLTNLDHMSRSYESRRRLESSLPLREEAEECTTTSSASPSLL